MNAKLKVGDMVRRIDGDHLSEATATIDHIHPNGKFAGVITDDGVKLTEAVDVLVRVEPPR